MNKKLILITGILLLIVLAGCNSKPRERPITDIDVRKGIEGLTMEFVQNAPPERVFENSTFPIAVKLRNKGAFSIGDDKNTPDIMKEGGILVFGFEKAYVNVDWVGESCTENKVEECDDGSTVIVGQCGDDVLKETGEVCRIDIEGKSVFSPVGDEGFITINAKTKKIGPQSETHTSTILATACHPYKTVFGSSVCVDTDIYGIVRRQKVCNVQDLVFEGQGAPVAVTKIETRMLPQDNDMVKPHFIIHIKNKGNGEVISLDKVADVCGSKSLEYTDFNTLKINALLSGKELDCNVDETGSVRLRDKEDMIRCEAKDEDVIGKNLDAYTAPLRIELDYGYTFTISKDIIIEKILTH